MVRNRLHLKPQTGPSGTRKKPNERGRIHVPLVSVCARQRTKQSTASVMTIHAACTCIVAPARPDTRIFPKLAIRQVVDCEKARKFLKITIGAI